MLATAVARTAVARTAVARTAVARTVLAGTILAGTAFAAGCAGPPPATAEPTGTGQHTGLQSEPIETGPAVSPSVTTPAEPVPTTATPAELVPTPSTAPGRSASSTGSTPGPTPAAAVRLPPVGARLDYQLGGAYPPPAGVGIVARDSTDSPAPGTYSICYVNGFQTQPADARWWLAEHPDLILHDGRTPVVDPDWPDEYLVDTSTAERRAALAEVLTPTILGCARRGFDAVELDNLDSWTRSGGRLTARGALDLAARLITVAHGAGLAVAQKNAAEVAVQGRAMGFDFVVAEECHRWDECAAYTDVYGARVLDIEYADDLRGTWARVCADPQTPASVVLRDRLLTTPGEPGYVRTDC